MYIIFCVYAEPYYAISYFCVLKDFNGRDNDFKW